MAEPTYWTVAGFKTLPEMQACIEHCSELARYAKAVEDCAGNILEEAVRLRALRDLLEIERLKMRLMPRP